MRPADDEGIDAQVEWRLFVCFFAFERVKYELEVCRRVFCILSKPHVEIEQGDGVECNAPFCQDGPKVDFGREKASTQHGTSLLVVDAYVVKHHPIEKPDFEVFNTDVRMQFLAQRPRSHVSQISTAGRKVEQGVHHDVDAYDDGYEALHYFSEMFDGLIFRAKIV